MGNVHIVNPEVVIVGGGPGGAAAAYWLARAGHSVVVVEKQRFPRDKICGDGLTPRAIHQLTDMGFDFAVPELHKIIGLRAYAGGVKLEMPWPDHSVYPNWGAVIRRTDLDMQVAALAEKQGAVIVQGTTAEPVVEGGRLTGVLLKDGDGDERLLHPKVTVIADGSLSRFGRKLGAERNKAYPYGLAVRGYYSSPRSDDQYLESHLDIRDSNGSPLPGYGWIFPLGDGQLNIGAGAVSTFKGWKDFNSNRLMEALIEALPEYWGVTPESVVVAPRGGKLPMTFSVSPKAGPNWVLVGDAAGAVNAFNGEGIDYGYETGRLASRYISQAIGSDDLGLLQNYPAALEDQYGLYNKVARLFLTAIGRPQVMGALVRTGMRSRPLMEWVLKVMANLMEPEDRGFGEQVYGAIERIVRVTPDVR